jgi:hypothetical protein
MTNPAARELSPILRALQTWVPTIKKSTYADVVTFEMTDEGIRAVVKWSHKTDVGEWSKTFTTSELLLHNPAPVASTWTGGRRACTYARQVIQTVLQQRGV